MKALRQLMARMGLTRGMATMRKICISLAPSIVAASKSSIGSESKKPLRMKMAMP